MAQQRADISATQQRAGLLVKLTLFQQEQHDHQDQRQVMVSGGPGLLDQILPGLSGFLRFRLLVG